MAADETTRTNENNTEPTMQAKRQKTPEKSDERPSYDQVRLMAIRIITERQERLSADHKGVCNKLQEAAQQLSVVQKNIVDYLQEIDTIQKNIQNLNAILREISSTEPSSAQNTAQKVIDNYEKIHVSSINHSINNLFK